MCLRMHWKWKNVRAKIHDAACLPESACAFGCTVSRKLSGSHPWPCISARICMCLRMTVKNVWASIHDPACHSSARICMCLWMHCKWKTFGLQSMTLHVTALSVRICMRLWSTVSEKTFGFQSMTRHVTALPKSACAYGCTVSEKRLGSTPWPSANTVTQSS